MPALQPKFVELDFFKWVEDFKPLLNPTNSNTDIFETFDLDFQCVKFMYAFFPLHVWTFYCAGDDDWIGEGIGWVNRMHYYITEKPAEPNTNYQIV